MAEMLADNAGMAATGGTDPGRRAQQFHRPGKGFGIKVILHFPDAGFFNIISLPGGKEGIFADHSRSSFKEITRPGS
jgi:hypothetical protein